MDMVPLDGLFWSGFDSEYRSIALSHQDPHVFHPVILEIVLLFFDLPLQSRAQDRVGGWSEGRVGIIALIRARGYLVSSRWIYLNGCQLT